MFVRLFSFMLMLIPEITLSDGQYECGEHGRFEYCIDEIPGCVIGCHCHPGFYFDTDTKICEPNLKLLEHHNRPKQVKPKRRQMENPTSPSSEQKPSATPNIDDQVKEIKKETDDLGDWLYNQFFNVIENQVVNNTKDLDLPTRRTNGNEFEELKVNKKQKSLRKSKKGIAKKKLLRITENDSVFDMSSSSDTDRSDSVSRYTSDTDSDDDDDDEHGHKKIVMVKKKSKPLPSFIFLPNMNTPFYPPLGLPPPPVMPMYPMVPVPPVVPMFQVPGCHEETDSTTHTQTTETSLTTTGMTTTITTKPEPKPKPGPEPGPRPGPGPEPGPAPDPEPGPKPEPDLRMYPVEDNLDYPFFGDFEVPRVTPARTIDKQHHKISKMNDKVKKAARQKFIQRLKGIRAKNKGLSHQSLLPPINPINVLPVNENYNDMIGAEAPMMENAPETLTPINNAETPLADNVDFEFISELIHKVNMTDNQNNNDWNPFNNNAQYRRSNLRFPQNNINNIRRLHSPITNQEESYYSNIGRQIASLIRNIDTQRNNQGNVDIHGSNNENHDTLYFKENSPSSFWERSVRSPLTFLNSYKNKFEYLKRSNELLFNLENKVEFIATTPRTLNLQEIENIVNVIETAKKQIGTKEQDVLKGLTPVNKNFNINLWPQESYQSNNIKKGPMLTRNRNVNNNILKSYPSHDFIDTKYFDNIDRMHIKNTSKITIWQTAKQKTKDLNDHNISNIKYLKNNLNTNSQNSTTNEKVKSSNIKKDKIVEFSPKQLLNRRKSNPNQASNINYYNRYALSNIEVGVYRRTTYRPERYFYRANYFSNDMEPF